MNKAKQLFLGIALTTQAVAVAADGGAPNPPPQCRRCPDVQGVSGEVEVGAGYVSDDSFKYGDYRGLDEKGLYLIGNASVRSLGEEGKYWSLQGGDLGLDTRFLQLNWGKQGAYSLSFGYDEIPHHVFGNAQTPFRGVGGDNLTLPPGWVPSDFTDGMTALPESLRSVDLATERERWSIGASLIPARRWEITAKYRRDAKTGIKSIGGRFFTSSALLPEPIDYVTDQVDLAVAYAGQKWQAQLAYYGSFFRNENQFLTWQNPFTPIGGAETGQLALPPDNKFHQISFTTGYQFTPATRATAMVAVGRMTQDEDFAPYTTNPAIVTDPLPRDSLDGRVDTLTGSFKLMTSLTDQLRLSASYRYNDRDNKTPQMVFTPVLTDIGVFGTRRNLPYSFTRKTGELTADYRLGWKASASAGFKRDEMERTFQEIEETEEDTIWARLRLRPRDDLGFTLKASHAERDGSTLELVEDIVPPQNPLLRKFNLADRERDLLGVSVDYTPHERVSLSLSADRAVDDYPDSTLGLRESDFVAYHADASFVVTENLRLHAFYSRERYETRQAGSQSFSTPDWFADHDDVIDTAGFGAVLTLLENRLETGLDFVYSHSRGEIKTEVGGSVSRFPDLVTRLRGVRLYADYRWRDEWTVRLGYHYEQYRSDDWAFDGIEPDTVPNVLSLGEYDPDYDVSVVALSLRYRF